MNREQRFYKIGTRILNFLFIFCMLFGYWFMYNFLVTNNLIRNIRVIHVIIFGLPGLVIGIFLLLICWGDVSAHLGWKKRVKRAIQIIFISILGLPGSLGFTMFLDLHCISILGIAAAILGIYFLIAAIRDYKIINEFWEQTIRENTKMKKFAIPIAFIIWAIYPIAISFIKESFRSYNVTQSQF